MAQGYRLIEHFLFPPTSFRAERLQTAVRGKTILITGASYGIGETLALRLGEAGARLILVGRTAEKLAEVQAVIAAAGGEADVFAADLRDPAAVDGMIAFIRSRPQGLDIFINNAGKSIRRSIFESLDRMHDFERTMALNYHAPVQLCLGLVPLLVASRGQIINISALNVLLAPAPKWAAYQASKTAFDQWLRSVGPEVWAKGVSTCSIYLPLVRTRMIEPTEHYKNAPAMSTNHVARIVGKCIYKRRRRHKPWWLIFPEIGSVIGRQLWERISLRKIQRSSDA